MSNPVVISESSVSLSWLKAVKGVLENRGCPLCVSITGLEDGIEENPGIRLELDTLLSAKEMISVRETSETIFPHHYWSLKQPSCSNLASWYVNSYLPRHRARVRVKGSNTPKETYFERLVAYQGHKHSQQGFSTNTINQLERIIDTFRHYHAIKQSPSPSKFIATCLNPSTDNTGMSPYVPFPCLQQVGFSFSGDAVSVTGYYTIQYLMKRGYGNYLGLCYLGKFMSQETGLPLKRVNCFVGNPRVDGFSKKVLTPLLEHLG